jgi:uncharacterized protein YqgC (DUF456 family)
MNPQLTNFLQIIAYFGIALGMIGTVAPIIPGTILIWFSVLLWAWADGFNAIGWPTLVVFAILAIAAEIGDLLFASWGAKKGGASWKSLFVAGAAAIAGFLIFNLLGAILGAVLGMLAWEAYRRGWEWGEAWRASRGLILGYVIAMLFKFTMGALMVVIFVWQAF